MKILRSVAAGLAFALAYLAWVGLARHNAEVKAEREMREREIENYRQLVPADSTLRINQFYASKQEVARGESIQVCYGVENAGAVRMEPPVDERLLPLPAKCFSYAPRRTTTLKLIAQGDKGGEATSSITIRVR